MMIHWASVAVGFFPGVVAGVAAAWQLSIRIHKWSELRALGRQYCSLTGHYLSYRVLEDGTQEPTGGSVEIAWQAKQGLLEASAFQGNGHPEWHSYIRMSGEYPGTGVGHYNNSNSIHGGVQQVVYSKQSRSFQVVGTSQMRREFHQCWKVKG
jgi:hypothetical protein